VKVRADAGYGYGGEASAPLAWVWSQYKGELPQTASERKWASRTRTAARQTGLGLIAGFLVVAGLTWLFMASPVSNPEFAATSKKETPPSPTVAEASPPADTAPAPQPGEENAAVKPPKDVTPSLTAPEVEDKLLSFLEHGPSKEAVFDLDRISFDAGKANLTASSREQLERVAKILSTFPKAQVVIGIHSDSGGTKAQNVKLSFERAKSVRGELVRQGVGQSLFIPKGMAKEPFPVSKKQGEERNHDGRVWLTVRKR
jgi:outer membrane protein OmpA-like peptidoglycan-associated protein